jgi:predicted RND superfamily exporter protein
MMSGMGENVGLCFAQLEHWDKRAEWAKEYQKKIKELKETGKVPQNAPENPFKINAILGQIMEKTRNLPQARIICFTPPAIMGLGMTGGVSCNLCCTSDFNAQELSMTAKQFCYQLMQQPCTLFVQPGFNADTPQLYLDIDQSKAETLGLSIASIYSTLQAKLASYYVNDFTLYGNSYYVKIQSDAEYRASIENIREIQFQTTEGDMVPLSSIAKLRYIVGPKQITRFNKMSSCSINAQSKPGYTTHDIMKAMESIKLPENYHIEWSDMSLQERQNQGQIVYIIALAMIFAYLFLVGQYESWTIPIPVMLSVAFASLGALLGLKIVPIVCQILNLQDLMQLATLSIYAQLGMVMLIGLAAKNAILMVEFSKKEREAGKPIVEAAYRGADLRYRAVLMTAWSFIFGVLPLVFATGAGAASRNAIGITTFSGMLAATFVGIAFTPALYSACEKFREWCNHNIWRRKVENYNNDQSTSLAGLCIFIDIATIALVVIIYLYLGGNSLLSLIMKGEFPSLHNSLPEIAKYFIPEIVINNLWILIPICILSIIMTTFSSIRKYLARIKSNTTIDTKKLMNFTTNDTQKTNDTLQPNDTQKTNDTLQPNDTQKTNDTPKNNAPLQTDTNNSILDTNSNILDSSNNSILDTNSNILDSSNNSILDTNNNILDSSSNSILDN